MTPARICGWRIWKTCNEKNGTCRINGQSGRERNGRERKRKMKQGKEQAVKNFQKSYNCCQAVACAYCEELGISERDMFRLTEGFGSGMGGLKDTCGALMGMFLTISLANSAGDMNDPYATKMDTYARFLEAAEAFREKRGSLYCRDLKTEEGLQPLECCVRCVETAAELTDQYLEKKGKR